MGCGFFRVDYLKEHPEVLLNEGLKESLFFTNLTHDKITAGPGDADMSTRVKTVKEYKELFKNATNSIIGEVSPDYLFFHEKTIPRIKEILGDPKIIIILRNPLERSFSSYMHLVRGERETLSFKDGLAAEKKRIDDKYWFIWYYKEAGLYYNQVEDYLNNFTNVKVFLYEDLNNDSTKLMETIFDFIGVDKTFKPDTSKKHNLIAKQPKSKKLRQFLNGSNTIKTFLKAKLKLLGIYSVAYNILESMRKINDNGFKTHMVDSKIKHELIEYFREDINKLSKLITQLSHIDSSKTPTKTYLRNPINRHFQL